MGTESKGALSKPRQALIEQMQEILFGRIEQLEIRDGEPVLDPPARVLKEIVFGKSNGPHPALAKSDFALKEQVVELFRFFDRERTLTIEALVIQHGLPVRMTVAR